MSEKADGEQARFDQEWRERIVRDLAELKTMSALGNQKVDSLTLQLNGRIKRLEKTVFGDEELKVIGLAEQQRGDAREIKDLNKKWAAIIAVTVFLAQHAANYIGKKMDPETTWPLTEIHEQVQDTLEKQESEHAR